MVLIKFNCKKKKNRVKLFHMLIDWIRLWYSAIFVEMNFIVVDKLASKLAT